ncbi:hypothetical protein GLX30_24980 [Streptomyces sp. Tu 2975]|uniref:hypothetical protein n=1 Tax=Streptomyces sp. Tu 2975 TaxID=2676871 RepID=UPI00135C6EE6|nr:hypothetical protein [Streptomyces sp. Tu 2975]QIP86732.1 hypothetical protein GLX30_24980 [Streptomyces sp. Tu 2975]
MPHPNPHESSRTAVPPAYPGDAGDLEVPAAPVGRDGKDDIRATGLRPERGAAHGSRPGPVDEPLKPVLDPGGATTGGATTGGTTPLTAPGAGDAEPQAARLLPQDESERLEHRLHHALTGFVDSPRRAVEEAADVLEDTGDRITACLAEHRRTLRHSADAGGDDTEQLRRALQAYREVTERLLRI